MRRFVLLALALAVALPTTAQAQIADGDLRCLMVANVFASTEKDVKKRQVASATGLFYLGRIDGRVPPAQLKARILAVGKGMTSKSVGPTMNACVGALQQREQAFQALGRQVAAQAPKR
jgi:hypothetical protein